jgi:small redox-active disulfide protein 2
MMKIEVLGSGCAKCIELERRVKEFVVKNNIKAEVVHVYDVEEIMRREIYSVPALSVDGQVVLSGKLPSPTELKELLG